MKITALEEYGLRCMILLTRHGEESPLTLNEISDKEGITVAYAGKLMMILKNAGLVEAVRGRNGGYILSKSAENINLKQIFDALGKPIGGNDHCERYLNKDGFCVHNDDCNIRGIWNLFGNFIDHFAENVSLAQIASGKYTLNNKVDLNRYFSLLSDAYL